MEKFVRTDPDRKVYVDVDATFEADGRLIPRAVYWEDGSRYEISGIRSCTPAMAKHCGGYGQRYTVVINKQVTFLFYERIMRWDDNCPGRWFVEKKEG